MDTTANGAAAGSDGSSGVAVGAVLALTFANHLVEAFTERNIDATGAVTFKASGRSDTEAEAKATASGGKTKSDATSDSDGDVKAQNDDQLTNANSLASQNGSTTSGNSETPKPSTSDSGDGSSGGVEVAAAVAINVVSSTSRATIGDDLSVTAGGKLSVLSEANTDAKATADGSAKDAGSAGIGAAVAVNVPTVVNEASLGFGVQTTSNGLEVSALMRAVGVVPEKRHTFAAETNAGAGATDVGIAGALSINIVSNHTDALIKGAPARGPPFANVNAGAGAVQIKAESNEDDTAKATSEAKGGGSSVGVGASVALNILSDSRTVAEVQNGVVLFGSGITTVLVEALADRKVVTTVEAGSEGGTAVTPAVALALDTGDVVTARLGDNGGVPMPTLTGSGAVTVHAKHTADFSQTSAKAEAVGSSAAIGADVAIVIVLDWSTTAAVERNVTGASVEIEAESELASTADARASSSGSDSGDDNADDKANNQVKDNPNTNDKGTGDLPKSDGEIDDANGTSSAKSGGESKSGSGVGVAAAVAVSWVVTTNTAEVGSGAHVTGTSGQVKVSAQNKTTATAKAIGTAIDGSHSTNIGAAVGLNVADVSNTASVGSSAHVSGHGVTVEAIRPGGGHNDFSVTGAAAAGGAQSSTSIAGSVGVAVITFTTSASIGSGAHVTSSPGGITVEATAPLGLQNMAVSGAFGTGVGVGAAVAVNVLTVNTTASVGSNALLEATEKTDVKATTTLVPLTAFTIPLFDIPLDFTILAAGGSASSGSTSVGGSVAIEIFNLDTKASIGNGVHVNDTAAAGADQSISVTASANVTLSEGGGGLGASAGGAGIGIGIVVTVLENDVHAWVGSGAQLHGGGGLTVSATATNSLFALAAAFGASTNAAGMAGAIVIVVPTTRTRAYVGAGTTIHVSGDASITASENWTQNLLIAGSVGVSGGGVGFGASIVIVVADQSVAAYLAQSEDVDGNGFEGSEDANEDVNGNGILDSGEDDNGDGFLNLGNGNATFQAGAALIAGGKATISATSTYPLISIAGNVSVGGGSAGVGVSNTTFVHDSVAIAYVGIGATLTARGSTGVSIAATTSGDVTTVAASGSAGGTAGVAGSAVVNVIDDTTWAFIGDRAKVNVIEPGSPADTQDVTVSATDHTDILSIAGSLAGGGTAGVGAGVDVGTIYKNTRAWIGASAEVKANDTVSVLATSSRVDRVARRISRCRRHRRDRRLGERVRDRQPDPGLDRRQRPGHRGGQRRRLVAGRHFGRSDRRQRRGRWRCGHRRSCRSRRDRQDDRGTDRVERHGDRPGQARRGHRAERRLPDRHRRGHSGRHGPPGRGFRKERLGVSTGDLTGPGRLLEPAARGTRVGCERSVAVGQRTTSPGTTGVKGVAVTAVGTDRIQMITVSGGAAGSFAINVTGGINVVTRTRLAHIDDLAIVNPSNANDDPGQSVFVAAAN